MSTAGGGEVQSGAGPDTSLSNVAASCMSHKVRLVRYTRYFVLWLSAWTLLKLAALIFSPLQLAPDEAHYWDWSRDLDVAYYSKGPIVAVLIRWSVAVFGDTAFAVRLPALVCSIAFWLIMFDLLRGLAGSSKAFYVAVWFSLTPFFAVLGVGMNTDPPCLLFWAAAIWCGMRALGAGSQRWWLGVGLCAGLAALSKYTALILPPSLFLFLMLTPSQRARLRSPWLWGGVAVFIGCLLPVLWWNWQHDWVNFAHNAAHLVSPKSSCLQLGSFFELVGSQFGVVGPISLPFLAAALYIGILRWKQGDHLAGYSASVSWPLAIVCMLVALTKGVYANWPIPMYIGACLLLAHWWAQASFAQVAKWLPWARRGAWINACVIVLAVLHIAGVTFGIPGTALGTKRLVGWESLGQRVETLLHEVRARTGSSPFVVTMGYGEASEIAFYTPSHPRVYCYNTGSRRMNQYDVWGGWEQLRGRHALIVMKQEDVPVSLHQRFARVIPLRRNLPIEYGGETVRTFRFFFATHFDGTPPSMPGRH